MSAMPIKKSHGPDIEIGSTVHVKVQGDVVEASYQGWSEKYNMAIVEYEGARMYRKLQITNNGRRQGPITEMKKSRFDINTRFGFIEQMCDMVIKKESRSLIVTGDGGLGKTFTVMARIALAGLVDAALNQEEQDEAFMEKPIDGEETRAAGDYEVVKGFITSKSLYRLLYENRDRMVIFDDCDSIWEVPTSVSLLKAALDSYETRTISWLSESKDDELPRQFEFTGSIIFVSNYRLAELDQAILSRCLYVDVSMTPDEKIERIRHIMPAIRTDMKEKQKLEALEVLSAVRHEIGDLNIRTFLKVCEFRHLNTPNWKDLAEYVITAF